MAELTKQVALEEDKAVKEAKKEVKKEVMKHQFNDVASIEERVKAMTFTEFKKGKEVSGKARVLTKA